MQSGALKGYWQWAPTLTFPRPVRSDAMIRRSFLLSVAALAAAGRPMSAHDFDDRGPWDSLSDRGRVFLWHDRRLIRPDALVLAARRGSVAVTLRGALPQFDENRLDVNAAPLVRPTIGRRLVGAAGVGQVFLSGRTLVAETGDLPPTGPAVIAYQRQSWDLPRWLIRKGDPMTRQDALGASGTSGLPVVGASYATPSGLLVALSPTIVDAVEG
jgi:hypothetical protein